MSVPTPSEFDRASMSADAEADALIGRLVEELAEKLQAGEAIDRESILRQHPELAGCLTRILPILKVLSAPETVDFPGRGRTANPGLDSDVVRVSDLGDSRSLSVLETLSTRLAAVPNVVLRESANATSNEPLVRPTTPEMPGPTARATRLQIFGEIATGGMGAVLKGRDPDLGRDVAVKVLLGKHQERPDLICRFIEEAQIGGQLQHPGIVPVYELGVLANGRPFFAMKLVKGQTLSHLLEERSGPHDLPQFLSIFESVCQTVAYAHARGVIHRDLKPSNVMVGSFGEVQVMDWGLAKVLHRGGAAEDSKSAPYQDETVIETSRTRSPADASCAGSILGTPAYMAPEQARGEVETLDERCDVFALGSILCQILTGDAAFTGDSPFIIQSKAAQGNLRDAFARLDATLAAPAGHVEKSITGESPAEPLTPADPELVALCKHCLAPEPEDRPRDAAEVAARVTAYRAGVEERLRIAEIERAEETARAEEATKRAQVERHRRHLTVALAASLIGLVSVVTAGLTYRERIRANRMARTEQVVNRAIDLAHQRLGLARSAPVGDLSLWPEVQDAAQQTKALLDQGDPNPTLHARVDELLATISLASKRAEAQASELARDRQFLERLGRIRDQQFDMGDRWDPRHSDTAYGEAFREFGIDPDRVPPEEVGRLIKERNNPTEIAFFLDDWAVIRFDAVKDNQGKPSNNSWRRLAEAASSIDPDPWRQKVRSLIGDESKEEVRSIARDKQDLATHTARCLLLLAQVLVGHDDDDLAEDVLKRAWRLQPDNFAINWQLAKISKTEKVRFASIAVALRPQSSWSRAELDSALSGKPDSGKP